MIFRNILDLSKSETLHMCSETYPHWPSQGHHSGSSHFLPALLFLSTSSFSLVYKYGLPHWLRGQTICLICRRHRRCRFNPWSGRSPGGGNGNLVQYSHLKNAMDRGAWWATVQRVTKSQTQLRTKQKQLLDHSH